MKSQQRAKLYKKGKYARKSTKNYDNDVKYIIIYFNLCFSIVLSLKNSLLLMESNNKIREDEISQLYIIVGYLINQKERYNI